MNYRNYNSLDRCGHERSHDPEFDDFGFDRRRYGSGRYVRNELETFTTKHDNPDLVQFGSNSGQRCEHECQNTGNGLGVRRASATYKYSSCDCSSNCKETKDMIGSYGVYCRRANASVAAVGAGGVDDDGGFSPAEAKGGGPGVVGYYAEHRVVVNSGRNGTTTNTIVEGDPAKQEDALAWCCGGEPKMQAERNSHWYRSSMAVLLLAISLAVLVMVSGLLLYFRYFSYVSHKPRESLTDDPCEKKYCSYDAQCEVENGLAICKCKTECPSSEDPVCGTDGVTYKNLCNLRATACQNKLNIRIQHSNECHLSDPCRGHVCPYGGRCVTGDGRNASCECPANCDQPRSTPVCGTDGLDYGGLCELKRSSCVSRVNVSVKYDGHCDPCAGQNVRCAEPEICQLDPNRNPVCRCSETCSVEFEPVCGSDGKTYSNECNLRQQACRSRKNLRIIYRGKCSSGVNPCANVNCKHNEECIINKFGIAACECVSDCESVVQPVCGSDGLTYDSYCHLLQSSCQLKNNVSLVYNGICGSSGSCSNYFCDFEAQCVQKNGQPQCECPTCSNEFDPVCGSDNISYGNLCKLQQEACQHQLSIRLAYKGLCNGCESSKCEFYAICEPSTKGEAHCVCPNSCPEEKSPVCGSDGNTYVNECELKLHSCKTKEPISLSYKGDCDICQGVKCKNRTRCENGMCVCPTDCDKDLSVSITDEPVCASDMNTYSNECEMQKFACQHSLNSLTVLFYGDCKERTGLRIEPVNTADVMESNDRVVDTPNQRKEACQDILCDFEGTCETGPAGLPRCSCIFDCSLEPEKPVCGSDLQMYSSICHMKMKACQKQEEIRLRPIELCRGMEVKPCNGKMPIVDPVTQQELDCGSGPNRKDCPLDSYCHHTSKFARCCPKGTGVYLKSCRDSWHGCCPDNKTPAQGPNHEGCPSVCNCNKLGSHSDACDPATGQCQCKPGVGGHKCDRCEPGFWGLPKISSGHPGCLPCGCSLFGSVRDDCEQMTGRCVCKPGVQGPKCTVCADANKILGPNGCVSADASTPAPTSCDELNCYFNATCEVHEGIAKCFCHISCPLDYTGQSQAVCGNDGQTYSSECQLKLYACRYQRDIAVQALSSCTDDYISGTDGPKLGAWTSINQFTEAEDIIAPMSKSTRHVVSESKSIYYTPRMPPKQSLNRNGEYELNEFNSGKLKDVYHVINEPTSATITALIGDNCSANEDCLIENSSCTGGICVCKEMYSETADRQSCSEGITSAIKQRGCASNPCAHNAECKDRSNGEFQCICPPSFTGLFCEISVIKHDLDIPAFSGQSFIQLKPLKAYQKFSVEMEFKSYTENGILLYSQQRMDGAGDFLSLALINGFVEFRYNLGNGPAILTSIQRLSVNSYHRIVAKRYQRDGILQVDGGESVAGQSEGTLKALDLNNSAFVGYVPISANKIFENIGTSSGFIGCIRKLKIGRHTVKLKEKQDSIVEKTHDLKECADLVKCENSTDSCTCFGGLCETDTNPCSSNPCQHGSICEPLLQGSHSCHCLPGHKGNSCETFEPSADDLYIPHFNGLNSFIKFPCLENVRRGFSIEIWFLAEALNGVLLYNGQLHNRRGDFISVNLVHGHVQFRYDLGSGIANITTDNKITLGDPWNSVKIHRFDRIGSVQLNNGSVTHGMSGASLNELNLELPLYVGGVPLLSEVNRESGVTEKFHGAIQRILINGKPLQLLSGDHVNMAPFKRHICVSDQTCLNGGVCVPYLSNFICKCMPNFGGVHCQNYSPLIESEENVGVRFNGELFLLYRPNKQLQSEGHASNANNSFDGGGFTIDDHYGDLSDIVDEETTENKNIDDDMFDESTDYDFFNDEKKSRKSVKYEFSIRTSQLSGLLLWSSRIRQAHRDYLAVALVDGFVEFSHSFGKEQEVYTIKSKEIVSDGVWHNIWILHEKSSTQIRVDSNKPIKLHTEQIQKLHLINGKIFIGGLPHLPTDFPPKYVPGFRGCLKKVMVDRRRVVLPQLSHNASSSIEYCEENDILV